MLDYFVCLEYLVVSTYLLLGQVRKGMHIPNWKRVEKENFEYFMICFDLLGIIDNNLYTMRYA